MKWRLVLVLLIWLHVVKNGEAVERVNGTLHKNTIKPRCSMENFGMCPESLVVGHDYTVWDADTIRAQRRSGCAEMISSVSLAIVLK
ncbi:hypothetical protein Bhyg_01080 [Pseudolycoriella hygida]|uniref:Uncharacterized protein n=1 Tax=Pseudolycoriella hygida TaxID=35572 RepID=A0A9Q0NAJ2_9DIPT|nr:hypothetical protein Bhyg_01080 [Pseudolycoriella hygida]